MQLQQLGQLTGVSPTSLAGLRLPQLQQQHLQWLQPGLLRGRESDSSSSADMGCRQEGASDGLLRSRVALPSLLQQQQTALTIGDAGLLPFPSPPALSPPPEASSVLATTPPPRSCGTPCCTSAVVTPAAAFARAAAAADGLLEPPRGEPRRCCSCCCSTSVPGDVLSQQRRLFRQRSSLLSNASVGRDLPGPLRPFTATAAPATAAEVSRYLLSSPTPVFPLDRQVGTLERLSIPLQPSAATVTGTSQAVAPSAAGGFPGEAAPLIDNSRATVSLTDTEVAPAVPPAPWGTVALGEPQQPRVDASSLQPFGSSKDELNQVLLQIRSPTTGLPVSHQRSPADSNGALGVTLQSEHPRGSSQSPRHNPLSQLQTHRCASEEAAGNPMQVLQEPRQFLPHRSQDWLGDTEKTQEKAIERKEGLEAGTTEDRSTPELLGGDAPTNITHPEDGGRQQLNNVMHQQLMQSYSGSVSSVDVQQLAALRVPLRQLLNDQKSLLETLDADYRDPPFATPSSDIEGSSHIKREEGYVSADAGVQVEDEGRKHHRELEVRVSVPMSLLGGRDTRATARGREHPSSSAADGG